jgi:predicted HTH transcriptional regulator
MPNDLKASLEAQLKAAESTIARLRAAIAILEDEPKPKRSTRKPAAKSKEVKAVVPLGKIVAAIKQTPGMTTSTLAKQLDGNQSAILDVLKEAESKGNVRREGARRATRWFMA